MTGSIVVLKLRPDSRFGPPHRGRCRGGRLPLWYGPSERKAARLPFRLPVQGSGGM